MDLFDKDFREIFSAEIVSITGGLIAGTLMATYTNKLLLLPGMFILLPGFLEMRGNISGSFASRLSSGLFLGVVKPDKINTRLTRGNLIASFLLAIVISFILGLLAFLFSMLVFHISEPKIILLSLFAGVIANAIEIPITLFSTFYLFRKGMDPNNIIGPILTSTGDVTSILALLITLLII